MALNLLIVESPSKAKTLKKYLGKDYEILASYGHVRDLPENPGKGLAMVYPVKGGKVVKAAWAAGWEKSTTISALRVEGGNKAGVGAKMLKALSDAGVSFRGLSAVAVGRSFVCYLALDSVDDATRAAAALRRVG